MNHSNLIQNYTAKSNYLTNISTEFQASRMIFASVIARHTYIQTDQKLFVSLQIKASTDVSAITTIIFLFIYNGRQIISEFASKWIIDILLA